MPEQTKKIFCPKCGSTNTRLLKKDYYTCNKCGTEFFIDEVGVNITQNINYNYPKDIQPGNKKKSWIFFLFFGVLFVFIFTSIIPFVLKNSNKSSSQITVDAVSDLDFNSQVDFFENNSGEPIMVISAEKKEAERAQGDVIAFVNMLSKKILKVVDIKLPPVDYDHAQTIQQFGNGDIYIIYDKIKIYKVNKNSYSVEDVTSSLFSQQPLMSSGVANAEFIYRRDGDGFKIKNNEGKDLFYYPGTDSIYNQQEEYAVTRLAEKINISDKLIKGFSFSNEYNNTEFGDDLKRLTKYDEKIPNGGPEGKNARNIIDFTPGRTYFKPKLLCFDNAVVLILFSITPAENAPVSLQCLDANTGAVRWTTALGTKYIYKGVQYKDGFMLSSNISTLLYDNNGKLISEFKFY